jgi:molecular chaperone GrpE (heat shock protein)
MGSSKTQKGKLSELMDWAWTGLGIDDFLGLRTAGDKDGKCGTEDNHSVESLIGGLEDLTGLLRKRLEDKELEVAASVRRIRDESEAQSRLFAKAGLERVFKPVSSSVCELLAQMGLAKQGVKVDAQDVFVHVRNLVIALEQYGMKASCSVGDKVQFDPQLHEPLGDKGSPKAGETVLVRIPGMNFENKVLRKAVVQKLES